MYYVCMFMCFTYYICRCIMYYVCVFMCFTYYICRCISYYVCRCIPLTCVLFCISHVCSRVLQVCITYHASMCIPSCITHNICMCVPSCIMYHICMCIPSCITYHISMCIPSCITHNICMCVPSDICIMAYYACVCRERCGGREYVLWLITHVCAGSVAAGGRPPNRRAGYRQCSPRAGRPAPSQGLRKVYVY